MKRFAQLFARLDETKKTNEKVAAMAAYFESAPAADAAWAVYFLSGRKLRQLVPTRLMCGWAAELAEIPEWLFAECYDVVGDLAETMALVLPPAVSASDRALADWVENDLVKWRTQTPEQQRESLCDAWLRLSGAERLVLNKLLTGAFRLGVSQKLVVRGLSASSGIEVDVLAHRLMGEWQPSDEFYTSLVHPDTDDALTGRPYPFFLAHPLEKPPQQLGDPGQWQVEWKWDGIRAQLIRRQGELYVWSRGEELMTERFPELHEVAERLPDGTVLDGEILAWRDGVLPFNVLQHRIGRKRLGKKILADAPVVFLTFDLLEFHGLDVRAEAMVDRRKRLAKLFPAPLAEQPQAEWFREQPIQASPVLDAHSWNELAQLRQSSRSLGTEGLMLKRKESAYGVGRVRGDWWKWKIDPYTIDAVMIYAQRGSGRRASLYTDYTFAVWDEGELVPFAKAYSGLTDEEIREVDRFVRQHTRERFGPVRSVDPQLVFELAFENIQPSTRHKSGWAVRFPRIVRWRRDKQPADADRLSALKAMFNAGRQG